MNYGEMLAMQDSGALDGAYRLFNRIKEDVSLGVVGSRLRDRRAWEIDMLTKIANSVNDRGVENQIRKLAARAQEFTTWGE